MKPMTIRVAASPALGQLCFSPRSRVAHRHGRLSGAKRPSPNTSRISAKRQQINAMPRNRITSRLLAEDPNESDFSGVYVVADGVSSGLARNKSVSLNDVGYEVLVQTHPQTNVVVFSTR